MEIIQSKSNARVKLMRKLQQKNFRQKSGMVFLEGRRLVQDAIKSGLRVHFVGFTSSFLQTEAGKAYHQTLDEQGIATSCFAETLWHSLSETISPQDVFAVVDFNYSSWLSIHDTQRLLILNGVQDPGNLGTLIRTADAFGVDAIIMTKGCCDITNPKVLRSAMASSFHIPILQQEDNTVILTNLHKQNFAIYATALHHTSINLMELHLPKRWAVVMGNEGQGVEPFWLEHADETVFIPMAGQAQSLNVSVAGAIVLYQFCCIKA